MNGWTGCWLAENATWQRPGPRPACDGALRRVHLIPRALLKREGLEAFGDDPRGWVVACGGPMGNGGCNGRLDVSRTIRVPRSRLPAAVEEMAYELELLWFLTREYGPLTRVTLMSGFAASKSSMMPRRAPAGISGSHH